MRERDYKRKDEREGRGEGGGRAGERQRDCKRRERGGGMEIDSLILYFRVMTV